MSSELAIRLMPLFTSYQARALFDFFGTSVNSGSVTLVNGAADVVSPYLTDDDIVFLSIIMPRGNLGVLSVQNRVSGESFAISSSSASDLSDVAWYSFKPMEL